MVHHVRREQHGRAGRGLLQHELIEQAGRLDVETVRRLVEDQQPRTVQQREQQRELLLGAARVVLGVEPKLVGHAQTHDQRVEAIERRPDIEPVHRRAQLERLETGQVGIVDRLVRHEADQTLGRDAIVEGVEVADPDDAVRRLEDPHQQPKERGLAGTVRTEQAAHLAGRDGERHVPEREPVAERLARAIETHGVGHTGGRIHGAISR